MATENTKPATTNTSAKSAPAKSVPTKPASAAKKPTASTANKTTAAAKTDPRSAGQEHIAETVKRFPSRRVWPD